MIKRIVKLTFRPEEIPAFLEVFESSKAKIRASEGCQHLELWRAKAPDNVLFTYSYWESEAHLNQYRHSELFKATWAKTKILFADKPEAWSIDLISEVE